MTALVEPPIAMSTRTAFSKAGRVRMPEGRVPDRARRTMVRPASWAAARRRLSVAGMAAVPGGIMPSASEITAIVLALPMTMQ